MKEGVQYERIDKEVVHEDERLVYKPYKMKLKGMPETIRKVYEETWYLAMETWKWSSINTTYYVEESLSTYT